MDDRIAKGIIEIKNRESARIGGIVSVSGFGEDYVMLETTQGRLVVEGDGLRIESLSKEDGVVEISGRIDGAAYSDPKMHTGLISRFVSK